MSTAVLTNRLELNSVADKALKAAAAFWFVVVVVGQLIFVVYIVSFFGRSVVEGDLARWNRVIFRGYIPGDRAMPSRCFRNLTPLICVCRVPHLCRVLCVMGVNVQRWSRRFDERAGTLSLSPGGIKCL
jgi:hypothetical protein